LSGVVIGSKDFSRSRIRSREPGSVGGHSLSRPGVVAPANSSSMGLQLLDEPGFVHITQRFRM